MLSIQSHAERGGSDLALVRMVRGLPRDEFECHVVVPSDPPLRPEFEEAGASVHLVPMRRLSTTHGLRAWSAYGWHWPATVLRLVRLVRTLDIDVVHTNSLHSLYGWAAAALTRRPHVWHAREIVVQSAAALRIERRLVRRATVVIAVSHAVAIQFDPANVVVVHESVDPSAFTPTRAGRFRAQLEIPDDAPLVAFAGRIDTWKGIDVLFDAWPAVVTAVGDARLVVAGGIVQGKEDFAAELGRRAAGLPGVHWTGPRDDIADLLADSDAVAVPSTEPEPYGLVAVEALASGAPVVASDAGGIREIVEAADPGAGTLVAPSDAPALAAALVTVLQAARPTSTARRSSRPSLRTPAADPTPSILHEAVAARPH